MSLRKSQSLCGSDSVRRLEVLCQVYFCHVLSKLEKGCRRKVWLWVCARAHCGFVCYTGRRLPVEGKKESRAERMVGLLLAASPVARNSQVCHHLSSAQGPTHT